ncbi:LysM peptidoglycan-binding domain-containing protein [Pseudoflavonifractor phocaeensis]|uniref:LysM peptidoglycan-binding domain-containing protein n=1 Tax=Pseudoflavonifractor phocaeensis TaxID=1870988 RepID=UPI00210C77E6|nr:LysM domain-containing protein [Pseudoflavonifractor phocaeensis]MCQ4865456.1 LysM domain-containing protein [Pseudoflavonifractor phocaeensis]
MATNTKKYITHKIVYGDALWDLAQLRHSTVAESVGLNGIETPDSIPVGTEIKIPQK